MFVVRDLGEPHLIGQSAPGISGGPNPCALIWVYALSWEARSQETSAVYQNPDFPCVRAINPTVTDSACVTAIARRH